MHTHWHMVSHPGKVDDYPDDWIGCRYKAWESGVGWSKKFREIPTKDTMKLYVSPTFVGQKHVKTHMFDAFF